MKYINPLILRFDAAYELPQPTLWQLEIKVSAVLLSDNVETQDACTRLIDFAEAHGFATSITHTKKYRVCHIYSKCADDILIGISTEVEQ